MADIETLAADIAASGLRFAFGITGSGASLKLADALQRRGVSFVRTQFEGVAAIMAGTVGRLSGRAGVAISIKGPGLTNMVPGLAVSWFESFPMVGVCEAFPPDSPPSRAHKRMDQRLLTGAISKGCRALSEHGPGFSALAEWAERERPGPVVLELTGTGIERDEPVPPRRDYTGDAGAVLKHIASAKRPIVIAGTLAIRQGWTARLNRLRIPVFSTAAAKGVVDESLPHAAGVYTGVGLELAPESTLLGKADLVIGLGLRPEEVLAVRPFPGTVVNIDALHPTAGSDAFRFASTCGATAADGMFAALAEPAWGVDDVQQSVKSILDHMTGGAFLPGQAFAAIDGRFAGQVRIVMDTGYFCTIGEHAWRARRSEWCLLSGQGRYMGTCLPMAIAAGLADNSVPTVAVVGDGGIGPFVGEMRLAVERSLPLLVVLMTDGRFASVRTGALKDGLSEAPLTMAQPSWMRVMEGMGLRAWRVENLDGLNVALADWRPDQGPGYIEIAFEPDSYERMVQGIR